MFGDAPEAQIQNTTSDLENLGNKKINNETHRIPTQDAPEDLKNLAIKFNNKERSYKMMLPDECFQDKCVVCRNNSCCSFQGN